MFSGELTKQTPTKKSEIVLFFLLTAILIPGLTVALVGVYGFSIWFYQILVSGPPTG